MPREPSIQVGSRGQQGLDADGTAVPSRSAGARGDRQSGYSRRAPRGERHTVGAVGTR